MIGDEPITFADNFIAGFIFLVGPISLAGILISFLFYMITDRIVQKRPLDKFIGSLKSLSILCLIICILVFIGGIISIFLVK